VEWIVGKKAQRGRKEEKAVGEAVVDDDDPMTMNGRLTNSGIKFRSLMNPSGLEPIFKT